MTTDGTLISGISEMFGALRTTVGLVKDVKALLPKGDTKLVQIEASLEEIERAAKWTEAEIAKKLRYKLCRRHWPPAIMEDIGDGFWQCPEDGYIEGPRKPIDTIRPLRRRHRH